VFDYIERFYNPRRRHSTIVAAKMPQKSREEIQAHEKTHGLGASWGEEENRAVVRVFDEKEVMVRRSRGYAPAPVRTSFSVSRPILACGAELKSTFCLARDHYAYLSHHIGDLENFETLMSFKEGISLFQQLYGIEPELVAYDLHPDYHSSRWALGILWHTEEERRSPVLAALTQAAARETVA